MFNVYFAQIVHIFMSKTVENMKKVDVEEFFDYKNYLSVFEKSKKLKKNCVQTSMGRRAPCKLHLDWQNRFRNAEGNSNECPKLFS